MFTFPIENWVGGIFYEHSHRLIASTVGFLILVLAFWLWRAEPRAWVRRLGFIALGAVSRRACSAASRCCGTCRIRSRSPTPAWRRSCSASRRRSRSSPRRAGVRAYALSARRGSAAPRRPHAAARRAWSRWPPSTCRSSSARRCGTPTRGWPSPTSRGCSATSIPDHWDPKIAVHFAHRVGALVRDDHAPGHDGPRLRAPPAPAGTAASVDPAAASWSRCRSRSARSPCSAASSTSSTRCTW